MPFELMTIDEVAEYIRRPPATVRYWIATGAEIGPLFARLGRRRMARKADIDNWVSEQFAR